MLFECNNRVSTNCKLEILHELELHELTFRGVPKISKNFVVSVCPSVRSSVCLSVRMENLGFHWSDFNEILCFIILRKSVEKIKVSLQSGNSNWNFT